MHYVRTMKKARSTAADDLVSVTEAAELLGISRRAAYYLVKSGDIPAHQYRSRSGRPSGPIRIRRAEIVKFLKISVIP